MIPLQLELTNFLSYRETAVLDFDHITLACISGPNGAGKSSILDGITYALFGRSRSRSDDDIVNRIAAVQAEGASVRFTFALENNIYRVLRRKRARKATQLELQIATGPAQWKPLSESKLRETQAAIERLLRMNYDIFTNSSFLLQGRADEFTTKSPNKRKEILAELLGVTVWEQYREAAAEQRRTAEGQMTLLEGRLTDIEIELAEEGERQAALEKAQAERSAIVESLKLQEKLLAQMRQTASAIERYTEMVQTHKKTIARIQRSLKTAVKTREQRRKERNTYQTALADAEATTAALAAWEATNAALKTWQTRANEHNQLLQAKRPFELTIARRRSQLEEEQRNLEAQAAQAAKAAKERLSVATAVSEGHKRLTQIKQELVELNKQESSWQEARAALQQAEGERNLQQKELTQLTLRAKQIQNAADEKTAVQRNLQEAEKMLSTLKEQISAVTELNKQYAHLKAEQDSLSSAQPSLKRGMNKLKDRIDRLQEAEEESACPLCDQPLSVDHRQTVLADLQTEGTESAEEYRTNQARIKQLDGEINAITQTLKRSGRLERDQQTQQQRQAKAEARLAEIEQMAVDWQSDGAQHLTVLTAVLADKTAVTTLKAQVNELATAVQAKTLLQQEQQTLQKSTATAAARLSEIDRLTEAWQEKGEARLVEVRGQLTAGNFASDEQQQIANLDKEIAALAYDAAAHKSVQTELAALAQVPAQYQALKEAEAALKPLENALTDLDQQIVEQESNLAEQEQQLTTLQAELETLQSNSGDLHATEDELYRLRDTEIATAQRVGVAQQRLAVLTARREQKEQFINDSEAISQQIQRLKLLEKSCGRNGVQGLLIEHALPEIEDRANELLDRLTDGDMHVKFDTQRQLKSRDALRETLDIRITDKDGERPYDNYSGGEQFRVNFAIRLALSQLLANRAGARLQTLVIDEGFGSQDPGGRQRLVEAINTIKDDFACILVITHIDELRDAFPTRIEVRKAGNGSQITII